MVEWSERVTLNLSFEEVRRELTEPECAAIWFPDVQRVVRGEVTEFILDGDNPIRLRVVSETWTPDLDGELVEMACGAFSINGSLSLRTIVVGADAPHLTSAIEVLVHMETTDLPEARLVLGIAHRITREGLSRMEAMFEVGAP